MAEKHLKTHKAYDVAWKEVLLITDWIEQTMADARPLQIEQSADAKKMVAAPSLLIQNSIGEEIQKLSKMVKEIMVGAPPEQINVALSIRGSKATVVGCVADIQPTVKMQIRNQTIDLQVQLSRTIIDVNAELKAQCKQCDVRLERLPCDEKSITRRAAPKKLTKRQQAINENHHEA